MNVCILSGNLGADPEENKNSKFLSVNFSLAVKKFTKDKKEPHTYWAKIVCSGKVAENVLKYLKKGDKCVIRSEYENYTYEDRNKQKTYFHYFKANSVEFFKPKTDKKSSKSEQDYSQEDSPPY